MSVEWIETLAFLGCALAFELAERRAPARPVSRRATWAIDVLALLLLALTAGVVRGALRAMFDATGVAAPLAALPFVAKLLLGFAIIDLAQYWLHRAMHGSALLWRAHAFHHSPTEVHWLSGFRTSVVHAALFAIPQTLVPHALLGVTGLEAALAYSVGAFLQLWTHANVRLPPRLERALERVLVTPRYHRAHHSSLPERQRKNLAMIFPLWDRLFGTHLDPDAARHDALGLGVPGAERPPARRWLGL